MGRWCGYDAVSEVTISRESFSPELFAELLPLAQKCWEESTVQKADSCAYYGEREFQIAPNLEIYQQLEGNGALVIMTLRDGGKLHGYAVGFAYKSLHHKPILGGVTDTFYVEPDYRSYSPVMVEKFEGAMRELGVNIIGWPTQEGGPVYELLKARGYVGDDVVMEKRLCA